MLRLRQSPKDDAGILTLIKTELVPQSNSIVNSSQVMKDIPKRLTRGITYVETDLRDHVIGFVHLFILNGTLIIDLLAVRHEMKRLGIGTKLLRQAEQAGRTRHCSMAILLYDQGNEQARRFYERLGYQVKGYLPNVQCYQMEKRLTP